MVLPDDKTVGELRKRVLGEQHCRQVGAGTQHPHSNCGAWGQPIKIPDLFQLLDTVRVKHPSKITGYAHIQFVRHPQTLTHVGLPLGLAAGAHPLEQDRSQDGDTKHGDACAHHS